MPPGYYIFVFCLLSISVVSGRKSDEQRNDGEHSNTMSRTDGENHAPVRYPDTIDIDNNQGYAMAGSGDGQRDEEMGSGYPDDDEGYDDTGFSGSPPASPPRERTKCEAIRESIRRQPLDGVFIPRCNAWGEYAAVQCDRRTSECWCVNVWGQEIPFTRGHNIQESTCTSYDRESEYPPSPPRPAKRPGVGTGHVAVQPPMTEKPDEPDDVIIDEEPTKPETGSSKPDIVIEPAPEGEEDDLPKNPEDDGHHQENLSRSIIQTPGLLPGIIGGAVVGLLCAVLLVMFIVYRMRKKDEGSYALEEPKMTSPSRGYTRAPTKEYWA